MKRAGVGCNSMYRGEIIAFVTGIAPVLPQFFWKEAILTLVVNWKKSVAHPSRNTTHFPQCNEGSEVQAH